MLVPQQAVVDVDNVVNDDVVADDVPAVDVEPTLPSPSPTTTPPPPQELPSTSQQKKIAQALKILKLKKRARKLKKKKKLKALGLQRLKKVETTKRIESSADTGRLGESQAKVYHIDLEHADKVLSMHDDVEEPTELQEVIEMVTTAKLITKVLTAATATISVAAPITAATIIAAPSAAKRRKGVVIRDPDETADKQDGIFISHDKYVAEILKKFGLTEKPLHKDPDGEDVDVHTYRSMIGSLMYLT
nr:hypothetical protein [Tanacetum cinerariifolium]